MLEWKESASDFVLFILLVSLNFPTEFNSSLLTKLLSYVCTVQNSQLKLTWQTLSPNQPAFKVKFPSFIFVIFMSTPKISPYLFV